MGDIDKISQALGMLTGKLESFEDSHKDIKNILVVMNDKMSQHGTDRILDRSKIDAAHGRLDKIEPVVDNHADKFKFMAWLIGGIATVVTFLVNQIPEIFGRIFH